MHILLFGGKGWIGQQIREFMESRGHIVHLTSCRADDPVLVTECLANYPQCERVISCIGRTHGGSYRTIDYLEQPDRLHENIRDNLYGPIILQQACHRAHRHFTYFGTGCIFENHYDDNGCPSDCTAWGENDQPNFFGSAYSIVKGFTDRLMKDSGLPVLNLRIRMPVSNRPHSRNFVTKLAGYENLVNFHNSVSVLPTLLPILEDMLQTCTTGTYNFTNPGTVCHQDIIAIVNSTRGFSILPKFMTEQTQQTMLLSRRSNNILDTSKLEAYCKSRSLELPMAYNAIAGILGEWQMTHSPRAFEVVLITGGLGFIGSHLICHLLESHPTWIVVNVDNVTYCANRKNIPADIASSNRYLFEEANIADAKTMRKIFKQYHPTRVFHLAAESHVDNSFGNISDFIETNVKGTTVLLSLAAEYRVERFLHMSTDEVYGETKPNSVVSEQSLLCPTNPYAATKVGAEAMCNAYRKSTLLDIVIVRCNNVYGPKQYPEKVIPRFAIRTLRGLPCELQGTGMTYRNFLHVKDACRALDITMTLAEANGTYNVGTYDEQCIASLPEQIAKILRVPCKVNYIADRPFNDTRYHINDDNLRTLGWSPKIPFPDGLADTVAWYRTNYEQHWTPADVEHACMAYYAQ